jgi:C4-dicarboxylate-specific signal transduction histidine kinase
MIIKIKDSLFNSKQAQQFQNIDLDEQHRLQEIEDAKITYRTRFRMYSLITGILIFIFLAFILWRTSRQRKAANVLLSHQKEELELTVECLKNTQRQLIQAEKMAAFGELTTGIAHEIQNPLNFVTNFAEVNTELNAEGQEAIRSENWEEAEEILKILADNNNKIILHGKRAESIVKGMLEHSRVSVGNKESIDINMLTDEYLHVSYQGFKAKDKNFKARLETDYDMGIGNIEVVPQDLGRVLLNVFNNAFYTVNKKKRMLDGNFEPAVSVCTSKRQGQIEIHIKDNGEGISEEIRDKVFQPFFTTKPAGQGIGLGLSLAYDIIRAEGGDIRLKTKEGEGTEFVIQLG